MRFEQGLSFEAWLARPRPAAHAGRARRASSPRCSTRCEMMHAANFLHRDIAPDNIIVRADGTPGAARFRRGAPRRRRDEPLAHRHRQGRLLAARAVLLRRPPAGALVRSLRARRHALPRRHRQAARGSHAARRRGPHGLGGAGAPRANTARASSPPSTPASRSGTRSGPSRWRSCGRCCWRDRASPKPADRALGQGIHEVRQEATAEPSAAPNAVQPAATRWLATAGALWPCWAAPMAGWSTRAGSRPASRPRRRAARPSAAEA